ncbi:MAG: PA14 domain-containing protein [Verrucomicrobiota bacterium]|nr:PA14 domain-containing protein [Limisphaera sp.]MDW8380797.1 PA14 domain-containing protein [Verrucomicrobiota bacterium]
MKAMRSPLALFSVVMTATVGAQTWTGRDVGNPGLPGSHTGSAPSLMTVVGGGDDIWNQFDSFYYYYTVVEGHAWDAKVRVHDLQGPDWWTKCELMVRVPDASGLPQGPDPFIAAMTTRSAGQNQVAPQWRATRGGSADWSDFGRSVAPSYPNTWLRLTRQGSVITMWYGTDGVNWTRYADINTASTQFGFGDPFPSRVLIGVAVTAHNNADPNGGIATVSDLSVTVTPTAPNLQIVRNLANRTVYAQTPVTLTFQVTNAAIANGSLGVGDYQWFKNNQPIPNATGPHYTFIVTPEDNNAQFRCRATVGNASVDSAVATLTVQSPTEITGYLKWEYFPGQSLANLRAGAHGAAAQIRAIGSFDAPWNFADNYASRVSGLFVPQVTGNYVFFIAADDDADLYLGTNASPASKRLIAQQEGWAGRNNWASHGGGGGSFASTQRRSDLWTPDGGVTQPYAGGIPLVAGQRYWIEAVHREGGGGDNLGVYVKRVEDPDPVDGLPSNLTNEWIRLVTWVPTSLSITQQPQSVTQWEGLEVVFRVGVVTDAELTPVYQWQRNGVDLPGRTGSTLSFVAMMADNGARYRCVVSVPGTGLSVTSAEAVLTVQQSVFVTGIVRREVWGPNRSGITRQMVIDGQAGLPDIRDFVTAFDVTDWADNYVQRLSTWFVPPATGRYVFYLASDDDSDLFLSTDENEANKRLIARQTDWNGTRAWQSGMNVSQRNSETFVAPDGSTPGAGGIPLVAGQRYYLEAVQREGGGGDNIAVYYTLWGQPAPADGTPSNLRGNVIGMKLPAPTVLSITQQPQSVVVRAWHPAVFRVGVVTDAVYPPTYQWRRNGQPIANATTSVYSFVVSTNDQGVGIDCVVTLSQYGSVTSQVATVSVRTDTVFVSGQLRVEEFPGVGFDDLVFGNVGLASVVTNWTIFESRTNVADNYARRMSGFFIPPQTGDYVFFISSDDQSRLYISTNSDQPAAKVLVAEQRSWNNARQWVSGNDADRRRSDTFTPDGVNYPYAMGIRLEAGRRYYIEAVHREGGGGDNVAVTYKLLTEPDPMDGDAPRLVGAVIGYMAEPAPVERPVLVVSRQGNNIVISWSPAGGQLESSTVLGPGAGWQLETTQNPAVIPISGSAKYFRVVR